MADAEAIVRDLVNRDLDCAASALRQLGLRREMTRLIGEWQAAGGRDLVIHLRERVGFRAAKKDGKPGSAAARR